MLGFLPDCGISIGLGHVMRCMTLADAFAQRGFSIFFVISDSAPTAALIRERGFTCYEYPDGQAIMDAVSLGDITADCWVLDSYRTGYEDEKILSEHGELFLFSDFAQGRHCAHIVLDQTLGRSPAEYQSHVSAECCVLTGSHYQLIRAEFFQHQRVRDYRMGIQHILVSMGGIDHQNHTTRVLQALQPYMGHVKISVLLTSQSPALAQMQRDFSDQVHFLIDHPAPWLAMAAADLAIGAGGTSQWERIAAGLPSILIQVADNQRDIIAKNFAAGLALVSPGYAQLSLYIGELLTNPAPLAMLTQQCVLALQGPGQQQVLKSIIATDGFLGLRDVQATDCDVIFHWQQAPGIRRYCRDPRTPEYTGHCLWFKKVTADVWQHFYMIEMFGHSLGYVRLEPANERQEVSVLIDQKLQGLDVLSQVLKLVRQQTVGPLLAYLQDEDEESKNAFFSAGFIAQGAGNWWG